VSKHIITIAGPVIVGETLRTGQPGKGARTFKVTKFLGNNQYETVEVKQKMSHTSKKIAQYKKSKHK